MDAKITKKKNQLESLRIGFYQTEALRLQELLVFQYIHICLPQIQCPTLGTLQSFKQQESFSLPRVD